MGSNDTVVTNWCEEEEEGDGFWLTLALAIFFLISAMWSKRKFILMLGLILLCCATLSHGAQNKIERDEAAKFVFWYSHVLHNQMDMKRTEMLIDERIREMKKIVNSWDRVVKESGYTPTKRQLETYAKAKAFIKAKGPPER